MSAKTLTEAAVARLKPGRQRREVPDAGAPGLRLVIQPSGAKSWALRFRRPDDRNAKLTLGPLCRARQELTGTPVIGQPLSLAAARLLAADVQRQRKLGIDVIGERAADKRRRHAEREHATATAFGALIRQFVDEHAKPNVRRWEEIARVLGLHYPREGEPVVARDGLAERWADKPVSAIDGHDVYGVVDEARRHGIPGLDRRNEEASDARGRKVARALSRFFSWCVEHRKLAINPARGVWCPPPPEDRDRVLSEDEVRWFWTACDSVGPLLGPMFRLLLLTGCRRDEVRAMRRSEVAPDGTWIIPRERVKNRRPHKVPLPPLAREVLEAVPRIEGDFVFTRDGLRPIANIGKGKARLDAAMLALARAEKGEGTSIPPWRLHDLRRTFVTGLIELGVAPHVVETLVNHISGHRGGVAGVYNLSELLPGRWEALERWARHVQGLASGGTGDGDNVIQLPRWGA